MAPNKSAIEMPGLFVRDREFAEACAYIDVTLRAEGLKIRFDAGVLGERLDERTDGVLHHRTHLVFQLSEFRWGKSLIEPGSIGVEVKLGISDEKV